MYLHRIKMLYVFASVSAQLVARTSYLPADLYCAFLTIRPESVAVTPVDSDVKLAPSFSQNTAGCGTPVTLMFSLND